MTPQSKLLCSLTTQSPSIRIRNRRSIGRRMHHAVVALHNGLQLSESDLQEHCAQRVPRYMAPAGIEFRESLPKTSTGKIDRVRLNADAERRASAVGTRRTVGCL